MKNTLVYAFLWILGLSKLFADNPIIKSKFTADPCAMVYGNTVYLYTGHDEASTTDTDYRMNNWHVFSSQDMVNWVDHGQKLAVSNFSWANSSAFAGHTVHRNGKFYWYVPMIQKGGGYFSIGVAVADNPLGPFTDALGKALILDSTTPDLQFDIDPAVFIDDDGQAYIYWGNATANGPCKMAKLKTNMIELDGAITTVNIPNFTEAPYVHKKNGIYYLSYASGWPESIVYCTASNPTGPWTYKGVINTTVTSATNHQSIIDFKGKSYFVYHNAFTALGGGDYRRSVCVDLLNYNTNGTIQQVVRTTESVAGAHTATELAPWQSTEKLTGAHDPTMIRDDRGVYSLLTTNNLLEIRQSNDMVTWTSMGKILSAVPAWMKNIYSDITDIWAPQIVYRNSRYWVYYCGSSFGSNNSIIGVASSPTLDTKASNYAWTDHGEVLRTTTSNNYNAIDPELIVDKNGKVWLSFGSFWDGIRMVEIDPATGKRLASNTTVYALASRGGSGIEGPSTIEHNGYYYLFTSWDACCAGTSSTYRTMVGRATSANGSYVDKQNRSLKSNYSEELLKGYGRYYGPGGGSPFRNGRRDYYALHYYDGNKSGAPTLQIREIVWTDDNWPVLAQPYLGRKLSYEAEHAILTNASRLTGTSVSNKEYVGNMSGTDSKVQFYINAFAAGEYTLRVHYAAAASAASHFVKVNTAAAVELLYPKTATAGTFPVAQAVSLKVTLKEGANIIEFTKGTALAELDRIDVVRNTFEKLEGGAVDDAVGATYVATGNNCTLATNAWLKYENVDFANGGINTLIIALQAGTVAQFRLNVDTQTGTTNTTVATTIANVSNSFVLPQSFQTLTGVHDIYVTLLSGTPQLDYLQFKQTTPEPTVTELQDKTLESAGNSLIGIFAYPNPSETNFMIRSEQGLNVEVYNAQGQKMESLFIEGIVSFGAAYPKGVYMIKDLEGTVLQKLIKK